MQEKHVCLDQQMISRVENNRRIVTDFELLCFCDVLGLDLSELLRQCQAAGITMGIVSNKLDWAVKQLGELHFPGMMAVCVGERPGIRRKPAPDVILAALEELHADPARSVYIGDSEIDVATAKNTGIAGIAVTWGFRTRKALCQAGATTLVDSTQALAELLL